MAKPVLCVLLALLLATGARADPVADFFRGKTISIIIGGGPGGSYADYGQLVARNMGRFIPGGPSLVVQTMPGAGGHFALNHLAQRAPRDGTVISVIHVTLVLDGLVNTKVQFNPAEYQWIGRLAGIEFLGVATKASGIRSLEDARRREVTVGAPGPNNVPSQSPQILNRIADTRFKVITGYKSIAEILIAMDRGEVEMVVPTIATLRPGHWGKLKDGELVPVFAQAAQRLAEFPAAPTLIELARTDAEKAFLAAFTSTAEIGRSLATPPAIPPERLEALRKAFDEMVVDAGFRAEAARMRLELDPRTGAQMHRLVQDTLAMSPAVRDQARAFHVELFGN